MKKMKIPAGAKKYNFAVVFTLAAATFGLYSNTIHNGFVWDDSLLIANVWIRNLKYIPEILSHSVWGFANAGNYYRPGIHLAYMLVYHFFGPAPWSFHLLNILFNTAATVMVFLLAFEIFELSGAAPDWTFGPAFLSALLFTAHPIHTEAVAFAAAFTELSYTLFYIISLYFFVLWRKGKLNVGIYFSCLFFIFSFMCKETALSLPLAIAAYEVAFPCGHHPSGRWQKIRRLKSLLPYFLLTATYFAVRLKVAGLTRNVKDAFQLTNFQFILNAIVNFSLYIGQLLYPFHLNAYHVFHPVHSLLEWRSIISLAVLLVFISLVFLSFKRDRSVFFGLLIILIPLLPAFYLPAFQPENTYAERYLYLPVMGFAFIVSRFFHAGKTAKARFAAMAFAALLIAVYSVKTTERDATWKSESTLWTDTVKQSPDGWLPNNNLGNVLLREGKYAEAAGHFRAAMRLAPHRTEPAVSLGFALLDQGKKEEAARLFKAIISYMPSVYKAHSGLGIVYLETGRLSAAEEELQTATRLAPDSVQARKYLGFVYEDQEDFDNAIDQLKYLTNLAPFPENYMLLGKAYLKKGLRDKATESYRAALKIDPSNHEALEGLKAIPAKK